MFVGASMNKTDLPNFKGALAGNNIMRIFPDDATVAGKAMKVLPSWTDIRLTYCQENKVIPFVSTKVDGDSDGLAYVKNQLINMPSWITTLYITDRHEPEGDAGANAAATFKTNFKAFYQMLDTLPAATRAKIKCGPILTKTWTEKASGGNNDYSIYDPISIGFGGDFFGVDMYETTGSVSAVVTPSTLTTPANFVKFFKAYKYNASDARPRIWPEWGVIGMPADTDGTARANWITAIYNEMKTWGTSTTGWPWLGFIWWHSIGKATGQVYQVGQRRDFPLHLRTVPGTRTGAGTTADPYQWNDSKAENLPGTPPKPLAAYNAAFTAENSGGTTPQPISISIGTVTGVNVAQKVTPTGGGAGSGGSYAGAWLLGATMKKEDIAEYEPKLSSNKIFRIFPNGTTNLPPDWTDPRFAYAQRAGAIPFVSSNIDGDSSKFPTLRQWLINMPSWVQYVYITDHHEPENDTDKGLTVENYRANFTLWWNEVIAKLPAATRAKVRAGHILTRQWTENTAGRTYDTYDTGLGDFFGVDMYANTWGSPSTTVATTFPDPAAFVDRFKAYKKNAQDTRDRIWPEWGAVGIPADSDGSARAKWMRDIAAILDTWEPSTTGWKFIGAIWWNNKGTTSPTSLTGNPGIGKLRYFYLDKKQTGVDTEPVAIPGSPPAPIAAYNQIALAHQSLDPSGSTPTPNPDPGGGVVEPTTPTPSTPAPDPTPGAEPTPQDPGDASTLPADLPPMARLMSAEYTILITDKLLNVVGDPIHNWDNLDISLKWNEPSSGQFTCPGYWWIRNLIAPGNRVVVIRRVLGNAKIVLAGPIESSQYERSDDGENSGDGKLTVTFSEDLSWIAGRLTYPNPTKTPETQDKDFWVWNGNTEAGMLALVEANAGQTALELRRVPRLVMAGTKGLTGTVVVSAAIGQARFIPVTDCLRDMAYRGGGYGFRTYQTMVAKQIVFEVFKGRDLSKVVRFGFNLGNLKYLSYELTAPEKTAAIVGGQYNAQDVTAGADKFVTEVRVERSETQWGRVEIYLARPGNDKVADLKAEGANELNEDDPEVTTLQTTEQKAPLPLGTAGVRLASTAADTVDQRYGVHYDMGDIVSIEMWEGVALTAPIRGVHIQAFPTAGEVVSTTIGNQAETHDYARVIDMRNMQRRVGRLERNVTIRPNPTT
jgi:hypothetical protein